jgi:hypothetical protein
MLKIKQYLEEAVSSGLAVYFYLLFMKTEYYDTVNSHSGIKALIFFGILIYLSCLFSVLGISKLITSLLNLIGKK